MSSEAGLLPHPLQMTVLGPTQLVAIVAKSIEQKRAQLNEQAKVRPPARLISRVYIFNVDVDSNGMLSVPNAPMSWKRPSSLWVPN